jgi:uncharacterized membrane protein
MSPVIRWILGIFLIVAGLGLGTTAVFGGAFMTVGCLETPPDYSYTLLLIGGILTAIGAIIPAVMLIRQSKTRNLIIAFVGGAILSCGFYVGYFVSLGNSC